MAQRPCKIFIVEHDSDSLEMLAFLLAEEHGCRIETSLAGIRDNFDRIKAFSPDLAILDFIHAHTENWRLLDQLRADEATSSIPVLGLSSLEPAVEQSLTSYNVRKVLVKPFELDELSRTVADLLRQPKVDVPVVPERPGAEGRREAADILVASARDVVSRWLRIVSEVEPFKSEKRLRPRELVDEVPVLLWGTTAALRTGAPERVFEEGGLFRRAAIVHARQRKALGVSLAALIHEYALLRNAIWHVLQESAPRDKWTADDVFGIGGVVNRALDEMSAVAVESYGPGQATETA